MTGCRHQPTLRLDSGPPAPPDASSAARRRLISARSSPLATLSPDERGRSPSWTSRSGYHSRLTPRVARNVVMSDRVIGTSPRVDT